MPQKTIESSGTEMKVAFCIAQMGEYHRWRIGALVKLRPHWQVCGLQLSNRSKTYSWDVLKNAGFPVESLTASAYAEEVGILDVIIGAFRILKARKVQYLFICGYWPISSVAILGVARLLGIKCILMTDSHDRSIRKSWLRELCKYTILKAFHGALVGGQRQMEYLVTLGMSKSRITFGFDVTNNEHFFSESEAARANGRSALLPKRYVLSLGRLVSKKNIAALVLAFARLPPPPPTVTALGLVVVGDGPEREQLVTLARDMGLDVQTGNDALCVRNSERRSVLFLGFQDSIMEFYAHAEAFILPSTKEEWGLVVNEAMACGVAPIVSREAGCVDTIVRDSDTGLVFDPRNIESLVEKLVFVERDPEATRGLARRARTEIEKWGSMRFAEGVCEAIARVETR